MAEYQELPELGFGTERGHSEVRSGRSSPETVIMDRNRTGFTLIEIMIVVSLLGVIIAIAIPAMGQWSSNARLKAASRKIEKAFNTARLEAIRTGNNHIVFFQEDTANNSLTGGFGVPIVVIDDERAPNTNCLIDGGDDIARIRGEIGVNWGVSAATSAVPTDFGAGDIATGSSFSDGAGNDTTWVMFNSQGMPQRFTSACAIGAAGTGAGAAYVSNGKRDFAVVVSPLGNVRVHLWNGGAGVWTR